MKVQTLEKGKEKIILRVQEADHAYLNTIRRLIMNEVPVMAIEDVEFRKNNSIMYDEMISLRLGLIPLSTDLKSYNIPADCKCKGAGCAQCQLKLTLKKKADKNSITVYAKDIKTKDAKVKPIYPDAPIVKLNPGQEIECEMTAILGQGKEHSKWSPCLAWFKHYPHVKIAKQPSNAKELAEKYPRVLELKKGKLSFDQKALVNLDMVDEQIEKESDGAIKYEDKEGDYVLFIESWGQLPPKTLVEEGIKIYNEQLKEFKKLLK